MQLRFQTVETKSDARSVLIRHEQAIPLPNIDLANLKARLHDATHAQPQQLQRRFHLKRFHRLARFERFVNGAGDHRQAQIFRQQFLFPHEDSARVHEEAVIGGKQIRDAPRRCNPGHRFAFHDLDIHLRGHPAHDLHLIHLRQLPKPLLHARQVYPKDVFALAELRRFQHLLALQRPIRLHLDLAQLVIRILKEKPLRAETDPVKERAHHEDAEQDLRYDDKNAAIAMLHRFVRTHSHVEQMLLLALARIRDSLVARARRRLRHASHRDLLAANESSMMRAHNCG